MGCYKRCYRKAGNFSSFPGNVLAVSGYRSGGKFKVYTLHGKNSSGGGNQRRALSANDRINFLLFFSLLKLHGRILE
jgi:hypothetical protein